MKNVKNLKLTKAEKNLKNHQIPNQEIRKQPGNIGKFVENILEDLGYEMNRGHGVDMIKYNLDVKTKNIHSKSAYGIGSMHYKKIIDLDYDSSPIAEKLQRILHVEHNQIFKEVSNVKTLDLNKPEIQNQLRYAYNSARELIIQGARDNYLRGEGACGYFEKKKRKGKSTDSYSFRISVKHMKNLQALSKSTFENFFS